MVPQYPKLFSSVLVEKEEEKGVRREVKGVKRGSGLVLLAGCFWGSMGLFVRTLGGYGFTSVQVAALRMTVAAVVFGILMVARGRQKIQVQDLPLFLGLGLCSLLFFTVCYFFAIQEMSMSAAAILLYPSPVWVMGLSVLLFHEPVTFRKTAALLLAFGGCVLVSGPGGTVTPRGILFGLGSGLGYALYSILGTLALERYSTLTVTGWTFLIAAAGSWLVCDPAGMLSLLAAQGNPLELGALLGAAGLITAVVPYLCYTLGMEKIGASRAAILATVEPLVATLLGCLVYQEPITLLGAGGILLILLAVGLLNQKERES